MLEELFQSVLSSASTASFDLRAFLLCTLCSLVLGALAAGMYMYRNSVSKSFAVTLATLPAMIQVVIMLVNGNLGAGVAVMGAFSLVRFRSAPGTAREIGGILLAMAIGLMTGMGYLAAAALFALIMGGVGVLYARTGFGEVGKDARLMKITIPESLDYTRAFDDLFDEYLRRAELVRVRTASMGSLYKLEYRVILKDAGLEKRLIDELRCRNGNLDILCARPGTERDEL